MDTEDLTLTEQPVIPGPRRRTGNSVQAERDHIVRVLHSHPIYLQWLRDHVATALMAEAQHLVEAGHDLPGALLAARATRYRAGHDQ